MNFRDLELKDKKFFDSINHNLLNNLYNFNSIENNFQTLFCFAVDTKLQVFIEDDKVCFLQFEMQGEIRFFPPIVKEISDFCPSVSKIFDYCKKQKIPFIIEGLTDRQLACTNKSPNFYFASTNRSNYEYIYKKEKFVFDPVLQKAKYDQVKSFEKRFKFVFRQYENKDKDNVKELFAEWLKGKTLNSYDLNPFNFAIDNFEVLELFAYVLEVNNRIIGISIGYTNDGVTTVLFEKVDHKFFGANAAMVHYFAEVTKDTTYLNRQEDMGESGMRNSKLSYLPDKFLCKYTLKEVRNLYE